VSNTRLPADLIGVGITINHIVAVVIIRIWNQDMDAYVVRVGLLGEDAQTQQQHAQVVVDAGVFVVLYVEVGKVHGTL